MSRARQSGFTLVEVMIALVVATLAFTAAATALSSTTNNALALRERTLAMYIASNEITEIRLAGQYPEVDRTTREIDFANREWRIETNVSESGIEGLRRIEVSVRYPDTDANIRTVTGFVTRAVAPPAQGLPNFAQLDSGDPNNRNPNNASTGGEEELDDDGSR